MPASEAEPKRPIISRRAAREAAFQALYQLDSPDSELEDVLADLEDRCAFEGDQAEFTKALINGVVDQIEVIDEGIEDRLASGWELERIAKTDRNVLRLAIYELLFMPDIPPKVTINEAVTIAKNFGSQESGRFVNGLLAKLLKSTPKANWEPQAGTEAPAVEIEEQEESDSLPPEVVEHGSPEYEELKKAGSWTIRKPESAEQPE